MAQEDLMDNLVKNGLFQEWDAQGLPQNWSMNGAAIDVSLESAEPKRPGLNLRIEASGAARVGELDPVDGRSGEEPPKARPASLILQQTLNLPPQCTFLLSLWVKSMERVTAHLGHLNMAYTRQGEWQQLIGIVRMRPDSNRTLRITLREMTAGKNILQVSDVQLRQMDRPLPPARLRNHVGQTQLIESGHGQAYIVCPEKNGMARRLAQRIQLAIIEHGAVELPVVTDREVTEAQNPIIKESYRHAHLILLGRLGTNRAMWPAYNRFLTAVDGYYPGPGGYVVRTAANVLRNGKNHLIVGGSRDEDVPVAVDHFIDRIGQQSKQANGSFTLPWLLDVKLSGECLAAFQADDQRWHECPEEKMKLAIGTLRPFESGVGTIRRWYENAMGYYWSGWDSYRHRMVTYTDRVLEDGAYTHHYMIEFFIRTYDMLDDGVVFSDQQKQLLDHLIFKNCCDFLTNQADQAWMIAFSPPYDEIPLMNRHGIAKWMAELMMAQFLHDYFDLEGDFGRVIEFRRDEKMRFMRHMVTERWSSSIPGISWADPSHDEEIVASLLRFALDHELYEFFTNGNAWRSLGLEKLDHRTGLNTYPAGHIDHELVMGILANYHQDGRYVSLRDDVPLMPHPGSPFQGRYINGVRRYTPGPELGREKTDAWTGVVVSPLMPHDQEILPDLKIPGHQPSAFPPDKALRLAVFRSGFKDHDDYLAINGMAGMYPPGAILNLTSRGTYWLGTGVSTLAQPTSDRYFDQNAVSVLRTDRWMDQSRPYAVVAQRHWWANLQASGAVALSLDPFVDTRWHRQVIWLQPGLFLVHDQVTAKKEGYFEVSVNWRPKGKPDPWDGRVWVSRTTNSSLRLTPVSPEFFVRHDGEAGILRQEKKIKLAENESVSAMSLLQAGGRSHEPVYEPRPISDNDLLLTAKDASPIRVIFGPVDFPDLVSDAGALVLRENCLEVMSATRLEMNGSCVLEADTPVSLSLKLNENHALVHIGSGHVADVRLYEQRVKLDDGLHQVDLEAQAPVGSPATGDFGSAGAAPYRKKNHNLSALSSMLAVPQQNAQRGAASLTALGDDVAPTVEDAQWTKTWTYKGLQRPARIQSFEKVREEIIDFGREIQLAEIRAAAGPFQKSKTLPEIWIAIDTPDTPGLPKNGQWKCLEVKPQWKPTVETGGYGDSISVQQGYQVMYPGGVRVRYVRAKDAGELVYFEAARQQSRQPLRLEVDDLDADGVAEVIVGPDIWPLFLRDYQEQDDALAVLRPDGTEVFQYEEPINIQTMTLLDDRGTGKKNIFVLTIDAQLKVFAPNGQLTRQMDLSRMHRKFNEAFGRPNSRHPAGGFVMPYAVGLWRRDDQGVAKLVVSRYCSFSFLDQQDQFEGVLWASGYVPPSLLPEGIDFDQDGVDEQLCLANGVVYRLQGTNEPVVLDPEDPEGSRYYPQVYAWEQLFEPAVSKALDGARIHVFEAIPFDGGIRYVLVVRDGYLGIYDGREHRWAFEWVPLVQCSSAAVVKADDNHLSVVVVTADGLLWQLHWQDCLDKLAGFESQRLPDHIARVRAAEPVGKALLAGETGLYILRVNNQLDRIAAGPFHDARNLPAKDGHAASIVAVAADGHIIRLDAPRNQ